MAFSSPLRSSAPYPGTGLSPGNPLTTPPKTYRPSAPPHLKPKALSLRFQETGKELELDIKIHDFAGKFLGSLDSTRSVLTGKIISSKDNSFVASGTFERVQPPSSSLANIFFGKAIQGKGTLFSEKWKSYEGSFLNLEPHGYGTLVNYKNIELSGHFTHGILDGKFLIKYPFSARYNNTALGITFIARSLECTYVNGIKHGNGNYELEEGSILTLLYDQGKAVRIVSMKNEQFLFEGDFLQDEFQKGKLVFHQPTPVNVCGCDFTALSYEGEFKSHLWEGQGILYSATQTLKGEFKAGAVTRITEIITDEYSYKGETQNLLAQGWGEITYAKGIHYAGYFENSQAHGEGKLTIPKEFEEEGVKVLRHKIIEGIFKSGKAQGKVKINFFNGEIFTGIISSSDPHNFFGTFLQTDGYTFIGRKINSLAQGKGVVRAPDGTTYHGHFKDGSFRGSIVKISADNKTVTGGTGSPDHFIPDRSIIYSGRMYTGPLKEGVPHGWGNLDTQISEFSGTFVEGIAEGYGEFEHGSGPFDELFTGTPFPLVPKDYYWSHPYLLTYKGEYSGGVKMGPGVATYYGDWSFDGEFLNGDFEGNGIITFKDGKQIEGHFERGRGLLTGPALIKYVNGTIYAGHVHKNARNGKGKLTETSGTILIGEFKKDRAVGIFKRTTALGEVSFVKLDKKDRVISVVKEREQDLPPNKRRVTDEE